jgi:hypothetical protein
MCKPSSYDLPQVPQSPSNNEKINERCSFHELPVEQRIALVAEASRLRLKIKICRARAFIFGALIVSGPAASFGQFGQAKLTHESRAPRIDKICTEDGMDYQRQV